MELIDKSAVVAEIESKRKYAQHLGDNAINGSMQQFYDGMKQGCVDLLSFLDAIDTKEVKNFIWNNARTTIPEGSTNQIICIKEDGLAVSTIGKIVNGTVKWAYLDDLLNTNSFNVEVKEVEEKFECPNIPKQEWSEEDKDFMYGTLSNLTELKDRYGEGYGNVGKCIDWLRTLRPQNRWKPSDEQMEILLQAVAYFGVSWTNIDYLALQSLYFDLKKLKEE